MKTFISKLLVIAAVVSFGLGISTNLFAGGISTKSQTTQQLKASNLLLASGANACIPTAKNKCNGGGVVTKPK